MTQFQQQFAEQLARHGVSVTWDNACNGYMIHKGGVFIGAGLVTADPATIDVQSFAQHWAQRAA